MIDASDATHSTLYRDEHSYCAHAHAAVASDGTWLVVFNRAPRRHYTLHPPEDPLFRNVIIRSNDRGMTWSAPEVVPGYEISGTECAGLTVLKNGDVLLNQWQFDWYPLGRARTLPNQSKLTYPDVFMKGWLASPEHDVSRFANVPVEELAPWVRGGGKTFVHRSLDNGLSFPDSTNVDTQPFGGGYGMRGSAELTDGTLVLPLSDVPNYRKVFAVRSTDGGRTWTNPSIIAAGPRHEFEEPAIVSFASGKLLVVLRDNATRRLHQVVSFDSGMSWSSPQMLQIEGYPAHLLHLEDGRLLLTYGWRMADYGIRGVWSFDEGNTWDVSTTIRIRGGLPNRNLGYPASIATGSGNLFTVYYAEDETGCTCIMGTIWRP